jgi:hypothetical protein
MVEERADEEGRAVGDESRGKLGKEMQDGCDDARIEELGVKIRRHDPTQIPRRECPVPKPGGLVGELLGFKPSSREEGSGKGERPP